MRVFLAGSTGAVGKVLVPELQKAGHTVIALTRDAGRAPRGAEVAVADALNKSQLVAAVVASQPDVIVHQLTALTGTSIRNFDKGFALTNRLRTEGTDNLIAAAEQAGVKSVIAQSYAGWPQGFSGSLVKTEAEPLVNDAPPTMRQSFAALSHLEQAVTQFGGVVHRFGGLYGPGTGVSVDGEMTTLVRKRQVPIVGSGVGIWSFLHTTDAASAIIASLEYRQAGIFNIADDEPAATTEWLPYLAKVLGAKEPLHMPAWLGTLLAGEAVVTMMTAGRGVSNAKAKAELGWQPMYASWREGFRTGL